MAKATLDITKEHCPMTFVKTKLKLETMRTGDVLEVILNKGEPLDNIPKTVTEQGNRVIAVAHLCGIKHKVVIEKA